MFVDRLLVWGSKWLGFCVSDYGLPAKYIWGIVTLGSEFGAWVFQFGILRLPSGGAFVHSAALIQYQIFYSIL